MRVNLFSPFSPLASGIVTYCEDYAAAMEVRGVDVNRVNRSFWTSWRFNVSDRQESLTLRALNHLRTIGLSSLYPPPGESHEAINHFHVSGNLFTHILLRHFYRVRGPRVVTVHERHFVTTNPILPRFWPEQLRMLRDSDLIVVHTEELKSQLHSVDTPVEILGHGVYPRRYQIDQAEAKRRIGVQGPVVAHVGFLFDYKGVELLLRAAARTEATILIVGSGPFETEARRLARILAPGQTVFRPYASAEDFPHCLAAADVVVFPRKHTQGECSGVLVQAMAAGKAIVAHDLGCFREYLSAERGVLTTPGDVAELRAALQSLLASAPLRAQYGQASRRFADLHLAWDHLAERHISLFKGLHQSSAKTSSATRVPDSETARSR
jgi:rhamnosyl/mannosyltransferase